MSTAAEFITVQPGQAYRQRSGAYTPILRNTTSHPIALPIADYAILHEGGTFKTEPRSFVTMTDAGDLYPYQKALADYARCWALRTGKTEAMRRAPTSWPSPTRADDPIPAFQAPERPAEPEPEPDTPAVAVLRKLLRDRQAVARRYQEEISETEAAIAEAEKELADLRDELEHERQCLVAAEAEIEAARDAILAVGGSFPDDVDGVA